MINEVAGLENFQLDPYQLEGVAFIMSRLSGEVKVNGVASAGCILADPAGMGKKRQALAAVHWLMTRSVNPVKKVVIVCHGDVVTAWENEVLQVWDSASRAVVVVDTNATSKVVEQAIDVFVNCSPCILVAPIEVFVTRACFIGTYCDVAVCDNLSDLRNPKSPIAEAVIGLRADAKRLLLVSAPPSTYMLGLIHIANPRIGFLAWWPQPPSKKFDSCSTLILRRENTAVFDGFPSKTTAIVSLSPSPIQSTVLRDIVARGESLAPQFEAVCEILSNAVTKSECVVVIATFRHTCELLAESLSVYGIPMHVAMDAQTPAAAILDFNRTPEGQTAVLFTTAEVAGRWSLTRANQLVFLEYDSMSENAVSSIWRVGQSRECLVYKLVFAGIIDGENFQAQLALEESQVAPSGKQTNFQSANAPIFIDDPSSPKIKRSRLSIETSEGDIAGQGDEGPFATAGVGGAISGGEIGSAGGAGSISGDAVLGGVVVDGEGMSVGGAGSISGDGVASSVSRGDLVAGVRGSTGLSRSIKTKLQAMHASLGLEAPVVINDQYMAEVMRFFCVSQEHQPISGQVSVPTWKTQVAEVYREVQAMFPYAKANGVESIRTDDYNQAVNAIVSETGDTEEHDKVNPMYAQDVKRLLECLSFDFNSSQLGSVMIIQAVTKWRVLTIAKLLNSHVNFDPTQVTLHHPGHIERAPIVMNDPEFVRHITNYLTTLSIFGLNEPGDPVFPAPKGGSAANLCDRVAEFYGKLSLAGGYGEDYFSPESLRTCVDVGDPGASPEQLHKLMLHPQRTIAPTKFLVNETHAQEVCAFLQFDVPDRSIFPAKLRLAEVSQLVKGSCKLRFFREQLKDVRGDKARTALKQSLIYLWQWVLQERVIDVTQGVFTDEHEEALSGRMTLMWGSFSRKLETSLSLLSVAEADNGAFTLQLEPRSVHKLVAESLDRLLEILNARRNRVDNPSVPIIARILGDPCPIVIRVPKSLRRAPWLVNFVPLYGLVADAQFLKSSGYKFVGMFLHDWNEAQAAASVAGGGGGGAGGGAGGGGGCAGGGGRLGYGIVPGSPLSQLF